MGSRKLFIVAALVAIAAASGRSLAGTSDDKAAPAWLQQAAKATIPEYQKEVPAIVLQHEQVITLSSDGMMTTTTRYAVKLLTREGKRWADAGAIYLKSASKVKDIRAWLIRLDGTVKSYGKDNTLDAISDSDDIYDEYRIKTIDGSDDADVGMIFGYETLVEERPLFTQDRWAFQNRLPTLLSRYTLNLPGGWQATSVTFNHDGISPTVNGSSYTWELRNMLPIPPEPDGLSVTNLAPSVAISFNSGGNSGGRFSTWSDVSRWTSGLHDAQFTVDDEIAAKARELTVNASSEIDKIRAIAGFVQGLRYISIDIGVAYGNGYKPRPASLVLNRGYGDCKDKANLMRALLLAVKIDAFPISIYSGDPTYVRAEWPSPTQFNHCIIAIRVAKETTARTILESEKLGRLLIFDPTDPYTQLGDLPDHEQGSYALVVAGADGDLLRMPTLSPDANRLERRAEITVSPDGSITGKINQKAFGQSASYERGRMHELSAAEYKTSLERWLTTRVKGGSLTSSSPTDRKSNNEFDLDLEFRAPVYAQIMQGRLMMFKPVMIGRLDTFTPVEGKRITPILLDASSYRETIRIKLPVGFVVDEMPDADKIEAPFGKYYSTFEVTGDYIVFSRSLELNRTIIPPSKYDDVGRFFAVVRNAEQTPVVLIKK